MPLFGTNPMSVAAGGEGEEFALDMATSQVCFGEIKHRRAQRRHLDSGRVSDAEGRPTPIPDETYALSPLRGYKGQAPKPRTSCTNVADRRGHRGRLTGLVRRRCANSLQTRRGDLRCVVLGVH